MLGQIAKYLPFARIAVDAAEKMSSTQNIFQKLQVAAEVHHMVQYHRQLLKADDIVVVEASAPTPEPKP